MGERSGGVRHRAADSDRPKKTRPRSHKSRPRIGIIPVNHRGTTIEGSHQTCTCGDRRTKDRENVALNSLIDACIGGCSRDTCSLRESFRCSASLYPAAHSARTHRRRCSPPSRPPDEHDRPSTGGRKTKREQKHNKMCQPNVECRRTRHERADSIIVVCDVVSHPCNISVIILLPYLDRLWFGRWCRLMLVVAIRRRRRCVAAACRVRHEWTRIRCVIFTYLTHVVTGRGTLTWERKTKKHDVSKRHQYTSACVRRESTNPYVI